MNTATPSLIVALLSDLAFILAIIAGAPYELGQIAELFPPAYKAKIVGFSATAALLLKVVQRIIDRLQTRHDAKSIEQIKGVIS